MATRLFSDWMNCGTIGTTGNVVAETTVDATFRTVEAFDTSSGLNNVTADLSASTITITDAGIYEVAMFLKFEGSNKQFEFSLFVDGVQSQLTLGDRATGSGSIAPIMPLTAGAVLDIRQRSTDGGTALTIYHGGISVSRQT